MYTSALAGGGRGYRNRDKVYIPIYTKPDDDDDNDDDDATDYSVHMYLQTKCPKTETIWKIQVPYPRYYLTCPTAS